MINKIYIIIHSILAYIIVSVIFLFIGLGVLFISPFKKPQEYFPFLQFGCRLIIKVIGIELNVQNLERLEKEQAYVYMGNHVNMTDHIILASVVPRYFTGLGARWQFKIPIYGYLLRKGGVIPLHRHNIEEAKKSIEQAVTLLKEENISIGIMPEGTRSPTGKMGEFKKGGFHLAIDANAIIMPFSLKGAYQFKKKGSFLIYPGPVSIIFGHPIDASQYTKDNLIELLERVREEIAAPLNENEIIETGNIST